MTQEPEPMADPTYKALIFLKRRPGLSLAAFRDYYETTHAKLAGRYMVGVTRYVRRYVDPAPNHETGAEGELDFDVITEVWFSDRATRDAMISFGSRMALPPEILADEERIFDRAKTRYATVDEQDSPPPADDETARDRAQTGDGTAA